MGLSYLARGESTGARAARWPSALLLVPIIMALGLQARSPIVWLIAAAQGGWSLWCLRKTGPPPSAFFSRGVSGLLAGIVLVDWLAAAGLGLRAPLALCFAALFLLALLSQRLAPAT
jgi:hypothetical protein